MSLEAFVANRSPEISRELQETLRRTRPPVIYQCFENFQKEVEVKEAYVRASVGLLKMGDEDKIREIEAEQANPCFMPVVDCNARPIKSVVGSVIGSDGIESFIVRDLLGVQYLGSANDIAYLRKFYRAEGDKDVLFDRGAKKNYGPGGSLEAVMSMGVPTSQAAEIIFTSCADRKTACSPTVTPRRFAKIA